MSRPGSRWRSSRKALALLRALVALLLVVVLPARPAAACWPQTFPSANVESAATAEPCDGCDQERVETTGVNSSHDSDCPCPYECPPGCMLACGAVAALAGTQALLVAPVALGSRALGQVAEPPPGVNIEISHVPRVQRVRQSG
jgi:hypothetical protein